MQNRKTGIRYLRIKNTNLVFIIIALFLLGFIAGIYYPPEKIAKEETKYRMQLLSITGERTIEMIVPAVDENGNGVAARLITRVRPATSGYGMMLVSINDVLAQADTQLSARTAAKAAEKYTGIELTDFDIIYAIKVNASVIEGPSAGAAMAVSVVAALENRTIAKTVMITGTIAEDGTIGPAGAVTEKARAAKDNNITVFLVSKDTPDPQEFGKQRNCYNIDKIEYCEIDYVQKDTNMTLEGITIQKVEKLEEALGYFIVG
ncbi:MAG: hypothetical protein NT129_02905 [Candidatus Aenigmarchaeota archaeon]|nr:hypothetical protein [Candidatus Aenigmarchaeota archaeon]